MDPVVPPQEAAPSQPATPAAWATPPASTPPVVARPKGMRTLAIAFVIVALVLGGGGFAYALLSGKISLPFLTKQPTVNEITDALAEMKSARIGMELSAVTEARGPSVEPINIEKLTTPPKNEGEEEEGDGFKIDTTSIILGAVPGDAAMRLSTTTDWSLAADERADSETSLKGSFSSNGLTIEFDGATRTVSGTTYLMVNKLPLPIVDFSQVAGKWVRMPKSAGSLTSVVSGMGGGEEDVRVFASKEDEAGGAEAAKKEAGGFNEMRVLFAELIKDGAIKAAAVDEDAEANGKSAWKITLAFDPALYRSTFKRLYDARQTLFPGAEEFVVFTEERAAVLASADASAQFDALAKGMTMSASIDKKTRMPSQIDLRVPVALSDEDAPKLAGRQISLGMTITLSNINQPVTLAAPSDSISMAQMQNLIAGRSEEEAKRELQASIVSDLRTALDAYHEQFEKYPAELKEMLGLEHDAMADFETLKGKYVKVVVDIPNDQYSGAPFAYSLTSDGYALTYQMGPAPAEEDGALSMFGPTYAEGTNTMTPDTVSVEGDAVAKKDTDGDGLSDRDELRLGTSPSLADTDGDGLSDGEEEEDYYTSPKKADTDGDGFSDGDEVKGGFDPLTNAQTNERPDENGPLFLEELP